MEWKIAAVIGPRNLTMDLSGRIPDSVETIITSNAEGICFCAWKFALERNLPLLVIKPEYASETGVEMQDELYQNSLKLMVDCAQGVVAVWDGKAVEVRKTLQYARSKKKFVRVYDLRKSD